MKNVFLVVTADVERLRKHGAITYQSQYTNLVGLETHKSLDRIKRVGGVIKVEESRIGRLFAT